MRRRRLLTIALAAWLGGAANAQTQTYGRLAVTHEQAAVLALLDRLDPRNDTALPFVEVATGSAWTESGDPWRNTYGHGWLLESNETEFVVRLVEGSRVRFTKTPPGTFEYRRVGFVPIDFASFVREFADGLWLRVGASLRARPNHGPGTTMSPVTVGLRLCRACAWLGLREEFRALWEAVHADPQGLRPRPQSRFHGLLEDHLDKAILDLGDPDVSIESVVAVVDAILAEPGADQLSESWTHDRDRLAAAAASLRRQDRAQPVAKATDEDLVLRLVDVCFPMMSGTVERWPVPPMDRRTLEAADSPFRELVHRGLAAVPPLLAHLHDATPTRSWLFSGRGGTYSILSLGDSAYAVLDAIAGGESPSVGNHDWQAWYERVQPIGLREHKLRALAHTDPYCAQRAAASFLDTWSDELDRVVDAARGGSAQRRVDMLACVVETARERRIPFPAGLRELLEVRLDALDRATRIRAAENLLLLGSDAGARSIVDSWAPPASPGQEALTVVLRSADTHVWDRVGALLREPANATDVLRCMARMRAHEMQAGTDSEAVGRIRETMRPLLLALAENETLVAQHLPIVVDGRDLVLHTATVADLAAVQLARWFPSTMPFDPTATASVRRQRIAAIVAGTGPTADVRPVSARQRPSILGRVDFAESATALPQSARDRVLELQGHAPSAEALLAILVATARDASGSPVGFHLERPAGADAFSLTCAVVPPTSGNVAVPHYSIRATSGGRALARAMLRERPTTETFAWRPQYVAQLRMALARPTEQGIEITIEVLP